MSGIPLAPVPSIPVHVVPPFVLRYTCESLADRSEEHTSELQSRLHLVCRLLLEKKKKQLVDARDAPHRPRAQTADAHDPPVPSIRFLFHRQRAVPQSNVALAAGAELAVVATGDP